MLVGFVIAIFFAIGIVGLACCLVALHREGERLAKDMRDWREGEPVQGFSDII